MRLAARYELESGIRATDAMQFGYDFGPYDKAKFLAVRDALLEEWNPRPGSESTLVDMLVQIQCVWETWLGQHMTQLQLGAASTKAIQRAEGHDLGGFVPRRLTESESIRESAEMMERFHQMYLRTVRTLKELKRQTPSVVVQQAGQVNVGEQQVNVSHRRE